MRFSTLFVLLSLLTLPLNATWGQTTTASQTEESAQRLILEVTPSILEIEVGQKLQLTATARTDSEEWVLQEGEAAISG